MSPCIESIKLLDGELPLIEWHERRFRETSANIFLIKRRKTLTQYLEKYDLPKNGLYKIRVVYSKRNVKIEWGKYQLAVHRSVELRNDNEILYSIKSENRAALNRHKKETQADDFIIVKNGKLTDAWYSNVALLKKGKWYTPSSKLLNGVKRQALLFNETLIETEILASDISSFEQIAFINAMRDFEKKYTFRLEGNMLYLTEVP